MVLLVYYTLMLLNQNALQEAGWPAALGMWPVHVAFVAYAAWLLKRASMPASV
jgi:lipopolysaccharide export LptBFGC system permease protein LptF